MKKFVKTLAATLAAVLVFGMTVSAAGSTSTSTSDNTDRENSENVLTMGKDGKTNAVNSNNEKVEVLFDAGTVEQQKAAADLVANDPNLGAVLIVFNMTAGGATNIKVTFSVPGVKNGVDYTLVHWKSDGSVEYIKLTNNGDGTLTGIIPSCSPFAIVEGAAVNAVVAPKTGEVIALAAILAIVMMAGAVVCAKKARLQK